VRFSISLILATLALAIGVVAPVAAASDDAPAPHRHPLGAHGRAKPHGRHRRAAERGRRAAARRHPARASRRAATSSARATVGDGVAVNAPPADGVIFRGEFDSGFAGWHLQSLPGRATIVSGSAFLGGSDARFEVDPGDVEPETGSNRSEVSGPTFDEGQDLYIRDAIRVPSASTYQGPWQIVQQLHETEWSGSPGVAVFLDGDRSISLGSGDGSTVFWQGPALQPDRWYDLIYHVKLSQDPGVGFVEVWLDGVQQNLADGQTKSFGQTIQTSHAYLKAGIYRSASSTGTSIVEHDDIVVGESYTAVTAG
jgi:hypothetical protein